MTNSEFYQQPTKPSPGSDESPPQASDTPQEIGAYKIESLLEKGGMSLLYLGIHPQTHEYTTIKVLSPKFITNEDIVERFLREAEIIALADHPNIVKLYGHGKWKGGLYIAMEYIEGISLRQYILQTPISLKRALEIIIDISYALCHLHTHGFIHRDLKPENILVTTKGTIKLIDFGIAQLLTEASMLPPVHQRVIGTPIYMSPEQRVNPESVTFSSDIYSLGIIAYELILGKLSHGMIHLSLMPRGIQKILVKALQPEVKNRYQDIVDFIVALSSYLNSEIFEKDRVTKSQLSELYESLKRQQEILVHEATPQWPALNAQVSVLQSQEGSGIYQDFLVFSEGIYGIAFGETSLRGSEALLSYTIFRGILRGGYKTFSHLSDLAAFLNQSIFQEKAESVFNFNFVMIDTIQHTAQYLLCGLRYLKYKPYPSQTFKALSINPPLGVDRDTMFHVEQISWNPGDLLILTNIMPHLTDQELLEMEEISRHINSQMAMKVFLRKYQIAHKISPSQTLAIMTLLGTG